MKQVVTALVVQIEITPYTSDWKVLPRPKPLVFSAFEADIPEAVLDWVREKIPKEALGGG